MSIAAALLLSVGIAGQRVIGMFALGRNLEQRPALRRFVELIPPGIIAAVIAQLTFTQGRGLEMDARIPGVAVAAVLLWRGRSLAVVVVGAAVVAAGLRALGTA
jgi:branched-subunit amino acid transport protein